jgi:hypothetical protein
MVMETVEMEMVTTVETAVTDRTMEKTDRTS